MQSDRPIHSHVQFLQQDRALHLLNENKMQKLFQYFENRESINCVILVLNSGIQHTRLFPSISITSIIELSTNHHLKNKFE